MSKRPLRSSYVLSLDVPALRVLGLLALFVLCGCGMADRHIRVDYVPLPQKTPLPPPHQRAISLEVIDSREEKAVVGDWCNNLHVAFATNDIRQLVEHALFTEYRKRGVLLGSNGVKLRIRLKRFYVRACVHMKDHAIVNLSAEVLDPAGNVQHSEEVSEHYQRQSTFWDWLKGVHTGGDFRKTLERALAMAIERLVASPGISSSIAAQSGQ